MNLDATTVALVLSALANAIAVWRFLAHRTEKREIAPDPLNVRKAERFITEDEHKALRDRVDDHDDELAAIREKMERNYNTLMESEAAGRSRLHHEINALANDVSAVKAIVETLKNLPKEIGILFGANQRQ